MSCISWYLRSAPVNLPEIGRRGANTHIAKLQRSSRTSDIHGLVRVDSCGWLAVYHTVDQYNLTWCIQDLGTARQDISR